MDDTPLSYSVIGEGKSVEEAIADFNQAYAAACRPLGRIASGLAFPY